MTVGPPVCALCGLQPPARPVTAEINGRLLGFCCNGCRMVYTMLMETGDADDPAGFKETELYRRCVAAGVVPASQADLNAARSPVTVESSTPPEDPATCATLLFQCRVAGMWCPACAWVIRTALSRVPGVVSADCDFSLDRLQCRYDPTVTAPHHLADALVRLGYAVDEAPDARFAGQRRRELLRLIITALLSANVMMLSWALYSGFFIELPRRGIRFIAWPILVLATAVLIYGGGPILRKAWAGLRAGAPGMETLILLGAGSAYALSLFNFRRGSFHLYFDTAAMLVTLLLLGKWLESRAKERVRRDLDGFLALQPAKVRLCSPSFPQGRYVAAAYVRPGDRVRVTAEEVVPVDGQVLEGRATVDLAPITGEPEPVRVGRHDTVVSGSRLINGRLDIVARQVGDQSLLGQMIAVVQAGLSRKSDLEARSQRMLGWFVPLIVSAAAATAGVSYYLNPSMGASLVRAITVLVAACPCALGIAVPLARVAGIAGAGRRGLLVRDAGAFDQARHIDTVVFDKTGTMTLGKWTLECIEPMGDLSRYQIVSLALALETASDHPVAAAIGDFAVRNAITAAEMTDVGPVEGGICGVFEGQAVTLGNRRTIPGTAAGDVRVTAASTAESVSEVFMSIDDRLIARLVFSDPLRPSAGDLVFQLKQRGYDLHLISGDHHAAVEAHAAALGIGPCRGSLLPKEKADYIAALQARGGSVAMVGDGINDAAAMAQADLAVAVFSGAPLARQVGAVTLMRSDPAQLLDLLDWMGRVRHKVAQNLGWAWIYNLVAVPMAMVGWLTPLVAVSAMLLSSLTVIANTLLLLRHSGAGTPAGDSR